MKKFALAVSLAAVFFPASGLTVLGEDEWPQFRGPGGQGHTEMAGLPLTWSESENIKWKTDIAGEGHSSPVISGDQIWLTTAITAELSPEEQQKRLSTLKNSNGLKIVGELTLQAVQIRV